MPLIEGLADSRIRAVIYDNLQCPDCLTPTKAFGLLRIQAVSAASNFNSSVVRKTDWAAQQTRVRAIADKLVAL